MSIRHKDIDGVFGKEVPHLNFLRNTNQYSGADIIYFRLYHSKCRTSNPQEADLFYMPIMAHMPMCGKSLSFGFGPWACHDPVNGNMKASINGTMLLGNGEGSGDEISDSSVLGQWTDKQCEATRDRFSYKDMLALLPHFNEGTAHKHFVVLSNEHYLFRHCTGWFAEPEGLFAKAMRVSTTSILPESMEPDMKYRGAATGFALEEFFKHTSYPKLYSLAPPSSVHWSENRPPWDRDAQRPILMHFIGSNRGDEVVRTKIIQQCASYNDPRICSACDPSHLRPGILAEARNATFCLQPAGDSPSRKSVSDVIALGCIPVFFHPAQLKFYGINWDGWSAYVSMPRREFVNGSIDLHQYLAAIPKDEVQRMQNSLYDNAHKFQFQVSDNGDDQLSNLLDYLQRKSVA